MSSREWSDGMEAIRELGSRLPPEILDQLREVHDALGLSCVAEGEGLTCCVEHLLRPQWLLDHIQVRKDHHAALVAQRDAAIASGQMKA